MSKKQVKSVPVFSKANTANVDTTSGCIKSVVILQSGVDKVGDNFDRTALEQLVLLGNAQPQGVKSRFGHPNACSEALGTYIGRYKNFSIQTNSEGVEVVMADLHLDPIAKKSPNGDLYTYTLEMAMSNSDMFGNSIVYTRAEPHVVLEKDSEGNVTTTTYERFRSFLASDVVDSPAATTNLFKDDTDFAAVATEFLDENEQLFELLYKNQSVVGEFLNRYNHYKKTKEKMSTKSLSEKLKSAIGAVIAEFQKSEEPTEKAPVEMPLSSGEVIMVSDENGDGAPAVGDTVTDAAGTPLASATLELADLSVITTDENGIITEISVAEVIDDSAAETVAQSEGAKSINALQQEIEKLKSQHEAELSEMLAEVEKLKGMLASVKSNGTVPTGTQHFKAANRKEENAVLTARERMNTKK